VVEWSQFVTDRGTRINISRVAEVGIGTVFGAVFTGIVSVVLGLADIPIRLLAGLASFLGDVVRVVFGLPAFVIAGSWSQAVDFVVGAGPAGFLVAVGIVAATVFVADMMVSRLR
jgi:hypothetical protein